MARPKKITARLTSGAGKIASTASRQSTVTMTTIASRKVRLVSVQYMMPGPSIMRTAFRSLVARPVIVRRKLHQVPEQVVAQVVFDIARDPDDDHPHPVLEQALDRRQPYQEP